MAYEFADDDPIQDIPTTPDYWHLAAEKIFQIVPYTPVFVQHYSVIEDPKSRQIGVDTNDRLPSTKNLTFGQDDEPIGLLRVETLSPATSGYLIDLRYTRSLVQRILDFDDTAYKDEDPNEMHKTVPVLGAIFHDPEIEQLRLRSKYRTALEGFAAGLMEFVDLERGKRGVSVWQQTASEGEKTADTSLSTTVEVPAQLSEPKPDTD